MGNTTTHTHYTTSNTSSPLHPSTPHDPNPTAPSNTSHTPNSSPPHAQPSPNAHAPNAATPTATTDTANATLTPTPRSSTCANTLSTPPLPTTPTASPLTAPLSRAQVPTSQTPTGHPTPPTPRSRADCAKPNASRGQAGLTTTPTPAAPTPPRVAPKSKAGLPACSGCARGSTPQDAQSNCCCVSATDGATPKRWARWMCRTRSAVCARARTRAGAPCRRVRLQGGGVGGCGYCAWGKWTGGARWSGCRGRARWTVRDVLWSVRCEVLSGGIDGGLWGRGGCGDEALKNRSAGWCWGVDVVLRWLCAFRL
jgi:hypothetical protein